jgi:hypothetical protein
MSEMMLAGRVRRDIDSNFQRIKSKEDLNAQQVDARFQHLGSSIQDQESNIQHLKRMRKAVGENIRSHLQRLLTLFFWIVVDALILPAIAKVGFKRIKDHNPSLID